MKSLTDAVGCRPRARATRTWKETTSHASAALIHAQVLLPFLFSLNGEGFMIRLTLHLKF